MSGYDGEDAEPTETHSSLPFIWECIKPEVHDEPEEDEVSKSKNRRGPRVGKLLQYLNSIEDQEELEAKVVERDPESGQSLLLWATKHEKFLVVEWLIKKCGRAAFAFQDNEQEVTIYNKWKEIRKEEEERERKRIERAKAKESNKDAQAEEEEDDEENGQDASSKPTHVAVYEQLSDVLSQFSQQQALARIQAIGNLGLYQGNRSELGIKESLGQCMYPNGDMYIGEYQYNTRHGIGTYAWNNAGILYIGHWKEGMRCGLGRIVYADGGRYYGSWWADERSGHGQYTYPNGDIYTGEWYRNERSGSGTLTFCSDGSKYVGIWERHGQFLRGEWCMPCGMKYIGSFENMKPAGHGFFVFSNGTYQEGSWTPKTGALSESVWSPKNVGSVYNGVHAKGVLLSHGTWKEALTPQITIRGFEIRLTGELSAGGFTRLLDVTSMRGLRRWIDQQPRDVPQCEREPIQILDLRMDRFVSSHAQWLRAKVSPELTLDVYEDSVALAVVLIPNSRLADARILLCSDTWYHPEQKEEDTNSSQCLVPPRVYLTGAREYDGQFIRSFCAVHLLNPSKAKNKSGTVSSSESAVQLTFPLRTESDTRVLPPLEEEKESALNIETSVVEHVDYRLFVHPVQDAFIWKQLVDTSESGGLRWIEDASLPGIRLVPLQEAIQSYESVDNASAHTRVVPRELLRRVKQYMDNNGGTLPSQTTQQRLRPLTPPPPMLFTELPVVEPLIEPPKRTTQEVDQE